MKTAEYKWDEYANVFSPITSRFQVEMYELSACFAYGSVLDCGCGAAKLVPYLTENASIHSYTGVDSSAQMIKLAENLLTKLNRPNYQVQCKPIEQTSGRYQCAISLQSYYSWSNRAEVIEHIYDILEPQGRFILATANDCLDIDKLLDKAAHELLMYPGWEMYSAMNRQYANSSDAHFSSLDELLSEVRECGFQLQEAHSNLFMGGVNFLVLKK
ncbi:MAG: class I SAM-dependent methyltransferase [Granulosicoccus sp.]